MYAHLMAHCLYSALAVLREGEVDVLLRHVDLVSSLGDEGDHVQLLGCRVSQVEGEHVHEHGTVDGAFEVEQ